MNPHTKLKSIVISKKLKKLLRRKFLTTNAQNAKCRIYFFSLRIFQKTYFRLYIRIYIPIEAIFG